MSSTSPRTRLSLEAGNGQGTARRHTSRIDGVFETTALGLAGKPIHHRPEGFRLIRLLLEFEFHQWFDSLFSTLTITPIWR